MVNKFCKENQKEETCPQDTIGKTGSEVCNQDAKWAAKAAVKIAENVTRMINPLNNIKSESESMQSTINKLEQTLNTQSYAYQKSKCENDIIQRQTNSITAGIPPECMKDFATYPKNLQDRILAGGNVSNVTQTNTATANNTCSINLLIQAITEMEASIDNTVLQRAANTAKGLLSSSSSDQDICNDISIKMSACKYINQTQCCAQSILQEQENLLKTDCGGSFSNIIQSNSASAMNDCMLSASASISDKMKATIKNAITQDAVNKSEGLTMDFFIIIIIIFCLLIAGPFVLFKYMLTKIFYIAGAVLMVAGVICGITYISSRKSSTTRYNQPYSGCLSFRSLKSSLTRSTLGKVKKFVEDSNDVIGYDFFIDLIDEEIPTNETARNAKDDTNGMVMYMTVEPKGSDNCESDKESAVISYIKGTSKPRFLVISILLLILGIVCICVGLFKDYRSSKPVVPLTKAEPLAKADPIAKADPLAKAKPLASTLMKKVSKPTTTNSGIEMTALKT